MRVAYAIASRIRIFTFSLPSRSCPIGVVIMQIVSLPPLLLTLECKRCMCALVRQGSLSYDTLGFDV
jgi:hypothetical protein